MKKTISEIIAHYDNENFTKKDAASVLIDTSKEDELFDYVGVEKEYVRIKYLELDYVSKEKDNFDIEQ